MQAWFVVMSVLCSVGSMLAGCRSVGAPPSPEEAVRSFEFRYDVALRDLPAEAKKVRVWIPVPQSEDAQTVSHLAVDASVPYRESTDTLYGNRMVYLELEAPLPEVVEVGVSSTITRKEVNSVRFPTMSLPEERLLSGDRLAPLSGAVRARSLEAVAGARTRREKARAIYDRVLSDVDYDKSGEGWGRGDVEYVCRMGRGNCSDFHSLFIAMARAASIPAVFEIGFPLPKERGEGEVSGYHCWAWYEDEGGIWVPVDASEADKRPEERDYFFGTLCENRVAFSRGRDLVLEPPQSGEPLNFFVYPYVEVDGKAGGVTVERAFSFRDVSPLASPL